MSFRCWTRTPPGGTRADELSDTLKNTMLLGQYMTTHHRGRYYAKAQNLVRTLRARLR